MEEKKRNRMQLEERRRLRKERYDIDIPKALEAIRK